MAIGLYVVYHITNIAQMTDFSFYRARFQAPEHPFDHLGLSLTFVGTSTVLLKTASSAIMTDAFFSRNVGNRIGPIQMAELAINPFANVVEPNQTAIDFALKKLSLKPEQLKAVIPVHSHHDHALDSARVCALASESCKVYGTASSRLIAINDLEESRIEVISFADDQMQIKKKIDEFDVTFIKSIHGKLPWPVHSWVIGEISQRFTLPASLRSFRDGGCISVYISNSKWKQFRGIIIHGSAGYIPGAFKGLEADLVFLGITLLRGRDSSFIQGYFDEILQGTKAKYVVPIHWDDFTVPLDGSSVIQAVPTFQSEFSFLEKWCTANGVQIIWMDVWQTLNL
jgi:hypothetical protein